MTREFAFKVHAHASRKKCSVSLTSIAFEHESRFVLNTMSFVSDTNYPSQNILTIYFLCIDFFNESNFVKYLFVHFFDENFSIRNRTYDP